MDRKLYIQQWQQVHREHLRKYHESYYVKHRKRILSNCRNRYKAKQEQILNRIHTKRWQAKIEVLTHYGDGRCACVKCNFSDIRALTIDHIDGGGLAHRKKIGIPASGTAFYRYLIKQGFPDGYQTLCGNCQRIKQFINNEWGMGKKTRYSCWMGDLV